MGMKRAKEDPEEKEARERERRVSTLERLRSAGANAMSQSMDIRRVYGSR